MDIFLQFIIAEWQMMKLNFDQLLTMSPPLSLWYQAALQNL